VDGLIVWLRNIVKGSLSLEEWVCSKDRRYIKWIKTDDDSLCLLFDLNIVYNRW